MSEMDDSPRTAYHHGNLKSALIEAGLATLDAQGEAALSLRTLARTVGVSANAAYRHFEGKNDLLNAMAAEGFRRFALRQRAAVDGLSEPMDRLQASGLAYVDFAQSHSDLYRLMFQQVASEAGGSPELMEESLESMSVLLDAASALLQAPAGDERVRVAAAAFWSLVHGLSSLAMGGQLAVFGIALPELIRQVMTLPGLIGSQIAES